jgi:hypothetical protein
VVEDITGEPGITISMDIHRQMLNKCISECNFRNLTLFPGKKHCCNCGKVV